MSAALPSPHTQALNAESTLKEVLGDEKEVLLFSEYCRLHLCEEQVLFWLLTLTLTLTQP